MFPYPNQTLLKSGSLTQTQTDDQLEHHVQNAFSQFGTCYVKIRRDTNGMPFAFVQYEVSYNLECVVPTATHAKDCEYSQTVEDAQRAITQGRGMHINNRPCRTEVAKVNRKSSSMDPIWGLRSDMRTHIGSLYLSRVTGGPISEGEARNILSRYGEIEKVWYSSPTESEIFRLPEGIWVMYKLFQPSRDAQAVSIQNLPLDSADLARDSAITLTIDLSSHQWLMTFALDSALDSTRPYLRCAPDRAQAVCCLRL